MVKISAHDVTPYYDGQAGKPAKVGPYEVRLIHDSSPENPWRAWDCQTPLAYTMGRRDGVTVYDSGDRIADFFGRVDSAFCSRKWRDLCGALDLDPAEHDREARDRARTYRESLPDCRRDLFAERLEEIAAYDGATRHLDALAALYDVAKVPNLKTTVTGYSQGDWAAVLLVATPEHAARCGYDYRRPPFDMAESLRGDARLFGSYLWGDVYGYAVKGPDGETRDSCFGFYGAYWVGDPNGGGYVLEEAARAVEDAARADLEAARDAAKQAAATFRETRAEWRRVRAFSEGQAGLLGSGALCAALARDLQRQADKWAAAVQFRNACAALLPRAQYQPKVEG